MRLAGEDGCVHSVGERSRESDGDAQDADA